MQTHLALWSTGNRTRLFIPALFAHAYRNQKSHPFPGARPVVFPAQGHKERGREEYRKLCDADCVVVSFGKSGRTWVRVLLSRFYQVRHGLAERHLIGFDNLHRKNAGIPKLFFTHDNYLKDYTKNRASKADYYQQKVILLVRDPIDVAVSQFFQWKYRMRPGKKRLNKYPSHGADMPIYDFVMDPDAGLPKIIEFMNLWAREKPHIKQLVEVYEKYGDPVITAQLTDDEGTKKYGIIEGTEIEPGIYQVKSIIEKPGPKKTKSRIATFGGYIFTPDIFKMLEKTPKGKDDELWLVDAIAKLMKKRPVYAKIIDGQLYDPGSKLGWLKANVEFALNDKEVKVEFKKFLKTKIKNPSWSLCKKILKQKLVFYCW